MIEWTAGTVSSPIAQVCAGDLISVRLQLAPGSDDSGESVDANCHPRHILYRPDFTGSDARPGTVGGQQAPSSDPLEYRVDLGPMWCPYHGQILLAGGVSARYHVWFERIRCAPRPPDDPTFTLRQVPNSPAVQIPRGAYALSVPVTSPIRFVSGAPHTFTISAGQRFGLGALAFGTIAAAFPPSAFPVFLQAVVFHLRF